jgi:hypothetical protein
MSSPRGLDIDRGRAKANDLHDRRVLAREALHPDCDKAGRAKAPLSVVPDRSSTVV